MPRPPNATVLCIDDTPDNLELLRILLNHFGYQYDLVSTPMDGLKLLEEKHFDLALIDILMPRMSGYDVIRHIRQHPNPAVSGLLAFAITAYSAREDARKALSAGFTGHIAKPIAPMTFDQVLNKCWDKSPTGQPPNLIYPAR